MLELSLCGSPAYAAAVGSGLFWPVGSPVWVTGNRGQLFTHGQLVAHGHLSPVVERHVARVRAWPGFFFVLLELWSPVPLACWLPGYVRGLLLCWLPAFFALWVPPSVPIGWWSFRHGVFRSLASVLLSVANSLGVFQLWLVWSWCFLA